ncbi:hypothetical protein [Streptomyces sp. NPDC002676]
MDRDRDRDRDGDPASTFFTPAHLCGQHRALGQQVPHGQAGQG